MNLELLLKRTTEKNAHVFEKYLKMVDRETQYEYMGMIMDPSLNLKDVLEDLKNKNSIFNSHIFLPLAEKQERENVQSIRPSNVIEGIYKCGKCGNKKIDTRSAQLRSADEPMNHFFTCLTCGNKWKR